MIPRYTRSEMSELWSEETKFKIWLEIETLACEAMAEYGLIDKTVAENIRKNGRFDISRIDELEKTLKHDVIAFLTCLAENIGEDSRFVHQGMTSSDILDTATAVRLLKATDILLVDLDNLLAALQQKALAYKDTLCIGRSHGIHAEPTTLGLKFASFYAEFDRNKARLLNARKEIATCAISGAVGNFANIEPLIEGYVAKKLGLEIEPISTQVIPRDRHAMYLSTLAVIAASIERLVVEIRHMQRTEVREAEEFFSSGQKGSSAMPHKRNPVLSENLTGLARMIRAYVTPALENVVLWHERDISHSAVERMALPDATSLLDFSLSRLAGVINNLVIYPENLTKNLNLLNGLVFSQKALIALTKKGLSREEAYAVVQENAMKVWDQNLDFKELLSQDQRVTLSRDEIESLFSYDDYKKHTQTIFNRVFK